MEKVQLQSVADVSQEIRQQYSPLLGYVCFPRRVPNATRVGQVHHGPTIAAAQRLQHLGANQATRVADGSSYGFHLEVLHNTRKCRLIGQSSSKIYHGAKLHDRQHPEFSTRVPIAKPQCTLADASRTRAAPGQDRCHRC